MPTIGFLHTSPVHIPTFEALLDERTPRIASVNVANEALLEDARKFDPSDERVLNGIDAALDQLEAAGASTIVCTCSTIGAAAEAAGRAREVQVVRVDRAMAIAAVRQGPMVAVVAAVESTLEPTRALVESVAAELRMPVEITLVVSEGAWDRFEAGDAEGYLNTISATCSGLDDHFDVVVLAQASMAAAAERTSINIPLLSSPRLAVDDVIARLSTDL